MLPAEELWELDFTASKIVMVIANTKRFDKNLLIVKLGLAWLFRKK